MLDAELLEPGEGEIAAATPPNTSPNTSKPPSITNLKRRHSLAFALNPALNHAPPWPGPLLSHAVPPSLPKVPKPLPAASIPPPRSSKTRDAKLAAHPEHPKTPTTPLNNSPMRNRWAIEGLIEGLRVCVILFICAEGSDLSC